MPVLDGLHGFGDRLNDTLFGIVLDVVDVGDSGVFVVVFHCDHVTSSVGGLLCAHDRWVKRVGNDCGAVLAVNNGGFLVKEFVVYCCAGVVWGVLWRFLDG